jgi:phytoene dehydrogenase-like protein
MSKSIIIIGGGIAGLSTGIYAMMNGYEASIYEMNSIAGGLCTAWKRKDFTFDGCLHWLTGSLPGSDYYKFWEEIGGIQDKMIHDYDCYGQSLDKEGNRFTAWTDPGKLRDEMLRIAPEDRKQIDKLISDIQEFMKYGLPLEINLSNLYRTLRSFMLLYKYRMPVEELTAKFRNPTLRNLFRMTFDWGSMCSSFMLWTIALMAKKEAGYPMGGSMPFIKSVEERFRALGGAIHFHKKVQKILVENDTSVGIRFSDGSEIRGDIVISAADGHSTIFDWLGGKYTGPKIRKMYEEFEPFSPLLFISLGIRGNYPDEPHGLTFELKEPILIGKIETRFLYIKNYSFDPSMAPAGKTVFTVMLPANYQYWKDLKPDRNRYVEEKEKAGEAVIRAIAEIYPGFPEQVEEIDIATPMTFVRYTGNWKGSYEGWVFNKKALSMMAPQTLPGLKNFYMAGHWVSPGGGLPSGVMTGRKAIQMICKKDKKKFRSFRP